MGQGPTWGSPAPQIRLEIQFRGCKACKKIEGATARKGRNIVSRKRPLGWVNMSAYNFFVSGPKFTNFFV